MKRSKIGHNAPCPCGSGKKYKHCCLLKDRSDRRSLHISFLDDEIFEAGMLSAEHNEKSIVEGIERLRRLLNRPDLNPTQRLNVKLSLARAYQRRGEHHAAIEMLSSIECATHNNENRNVLAYIKCLVAVSYCALGFHRESCDLFSDIFDGFEPSTVDPELRGVICLEAGKAFRANGDNNRAREFWEEALKLFEGIEDQIENYARAKANLGLVLLTDPDEEKQKKGVKIIEESSDLKRLIGDLEGLANNYCNLGMYYWRKKQYEPAIAYTRWDLYLSRKVGDLRAVASTLGNLAGIYAELKQLGPARQLLREAQQIGEALRDERLIAITEHNLRKVDEIGREAGQKGEKIGPSVECGCGSGKEYQECCGRADFEPLDIPMQFGGVSEDIEQIAKDLEDAGQEPSFLDIILRQTEQAGRRFAWARMMVHDSWLEMHELPDMANYHLNSAKILADESQSEPDSFTKPLACVILSVCALEAFINQVAFFLHETQVLAESRLHTIPSEIATDAVSFQRHTELTLKWEFLGKALCGHEWPPPLSLWTDFKNLIYIRNELVHFKAVDYEQVVPPLKKPHDIMRRVPEYVETRRIPHGWQARLLTPSFANWCVKVAESTIQHFKRSYMQCRSGGTRGKVENQPPTKPQTLPATS